MLVEIGTVETVIVSQSLKKKERERGRERRRKSRKIYFYISVFTNYN